MKPTFRRTASVVLALLVTGCTTGAPSGSTTDDAPAIPAALATPSGSRLVLTLRGSGLQHYECRATPDAAGGHAWVFVAPEAVLGDARGAIVGRHFAGPTWEHGDGSRVTGKAAASTAAPQPGAIPWLLLQATPAAASGALAHIAYVQRTRTEGGVAPSEPCGAPQVGAQKAVRYAADYRFFEN